MTNKCNENIEARKQGLKVLIATFIIYCCSLTPSYAVSITLKSLSKVVIFPEVEAPASVVSLNDSSIGAAVSGVVMEIPARVGDFVPKGEVLVILDATDLELEEKRLNIRLQRVQKQKNAALNDLVRKRKLKRNISKTVVQKASTDYAILKLDYEDTQVQLQSATDKVSKANIRAPFMGIVTERLGRVGEYVTPGKPLIRIVDVDDIEVTANVQTKDVFSLEKAKNINFLFNKQIFPLKLRSIVKIRDQRTRTQEVRLSFQKKEELPGTAGRLQWRHTQPHIPPHLLVRRNAQLGIFILKDKKAHFFSFEGALEGRPIPTILSLSTKIIVKGRYSIKHGTVLVK